MATAEKSKPEKRATRATRGTGRLYKRTAEGREVRADSKAPGTYWIQYAINGKRIRQRLTDDTGIPIVSLRSAREVQRKFIAPMLAHDKGKQLKVVLDAIEQTERTTAAQIRISEIWKACDSDHRKKRRASHGKSGGTCSDRTHTGYAAQVKSFAQFMAKEHPEIVFMHEVTQQHADQYADHMDSKRLAPSSFNQHLKTLEFTWRALGERANLTVNPWKWDSQTLKGIAPRSVESERNLRRKEPLTLEQVNKVMEAAAATDAAGEPMFPEFFTLLATLLCTGQRLIDCVLLKWKQIDFQTGVIQFTPAKTRRFGKELSVPLLPELRETLEKKIRSSDYVLPEIAATYQRDTASVAKTLRRIFDRAGIEATREIGTDTARAVVGTGAHSFRHAFVTLARLHGVKDSIIAQITGHTTLKQMDGYTRMTAADMADIANAITPHNLLNEPKATDREPLPAWAVEKIESMTAKNWKQIKAELLH